MHLVIRQRQYVLAYRLLTAGHYTFDLKLPNALGKTIPSLLSEGISSGLYEAVAKDDLKTASELLQPIRKPLALPLE